MRHYCKICGEYKSNESFSGRGHAAHICKKCAKLPKEVRDERTTLNRIYELPFRLSKANRSWLEKLKADPREAVRTAAESEWNMRFQRRTTVTETEEEYEDEWEDNPEYSWLDANGYPHKGEAGNFLFIKPRTPAQRIVDRMKAEKKILIKTYPGVGEFGDCLRVSIGERRYMERFTEALAELDR